MYKVSLAEVRQLCKEVITGVRIKEKDERYSDSLNFYLTNDFSLKNVGISMQLFLH